MGLHFKSCVGRGGQPANPRAPSGPRRVPRTAQSVAERCGYIIHARDEDGTDGQPGAPGRSGRGRAGRMLARAAPSSERRVHLRFICHTLKNRKKGNHQLPIRLRFGPLARPLPRPPNAFPPETTQTPKTYSVGNALAERGELVGAHAFLHLGVARPDALAVRSALRMVGQGRERSGGVSCGAGA